MTFQVPINNTIVPLRIKQARISRGLSQDELARIVGVTKQAISKYETGAAQPSEAIIFRIADMLHYSLSFFTKKTNAIASAQTVPFFRSYKTSSVKDKAAWIQKGEIFEDIIVSKLKTYIDFPKSNLPTIEQRDFYTLDQCEEIAMQVREYWGLGTGPIENLVDVMQINGIIIANMVSSGHKIDAFSTIYNGTPYVYISDDTASSVRWRFSLAHEIGHLVLHSGLFENEVPQYLHDQIEVEANYFASAFLMPYEVFFKDVTIASLDHFLSLKKKWKTSVNSMIMKCKNFEVLSSCQVESLYKKMAIKKWRVTEPLDDICKGERPYLLKQAFQLLLENGIIVPGGIEADFGLYIDELAEWTFTPVDVFKPIKTEPKPLKLIRPEISTRTVN